MTLTFPDILLAADEVTASIPAENIDAVTVRDRTCSGVYTHVQVHLKKIPSIGALLQHAVEAGLTEVDLHRSDPRLHTVRGKHGDATVELFAGSGL